FLCSSSSTKLRALSSVRFASYSIPFAVLIVGLTFSHILFYYEIAFPKQLCSALRRVYQTFIGIWLLIAYSVGPPIIMLSFGLGTIQHIRQSIRRTGTNPNPHLIQNQQQQQQQRRSKKTDRQLIQMMFVQCIVFILTASLPAIQYIYTSARTNLIIDYLQAAKDSAFNYVSGFISLTKFFMEFNLQDHHDFSINNIIPKLEPSLRTIRQRRWRENQRHKFDSNQITLPLSTTDNSESNLSSSTSSQNFEDNPFISGDVDAVGVIHEQHLVCVGGGLQNDYSFNEGDDSYDDK
ncbi:unnamed protein product, partial [Adineta ricciae]